MGTVVTLPALWAVRTFLRLLLSPFVSLLKCKPILSSWAMQKQAAGPTGPAGRACTPQRKFRWVQDPRAGAAVPGPGAAVFAGDGAWLLVTLPSCSCEQKPSIDTRV